MEWNMELDDVGMDIYENISRIMEEEADVGVD